jgi:hypothetical protein
MNLLLHNESSEEFVLEQDLIVIGLRRSLLNAGSAMSATARPATQPAMAHALRREQIDEAR